jgi:hypothetical protein
MSCFNIADLYAVIHETLRLDPQIQSYLGLTSGSSMTDFNLHIQKRSKPMGLAAENLPIITFYTNPGSRGENPLEYVTVFDFDIYTSDDVELAINIADRIKDLLDNQYPRLSKGSVFQSRFVTCAEASTDLTNTYKFFTQILFTLGIEEN